MDKAALREVQPLEKIKREEEEVVAQRRAQELKLPYARLDVVAVDLDALGSIPETEARAAGVAMLQHKGHDVYLGVFDPRDAKAQAIITWLKTHNSTIHLFVASRSSLEKIWRRYRDIIRPAASLRGIFIISEEVISRVAQSFTHLDAVQQIIDASAADTKLSVIFATALTLGASDIHIEPTERTVRVRFRVDGVLHDGATILKAEHQFIVTRIKVLAELKINVNTINQDGRFTMRVTSSAKSHDTDVRVSVIPEIYGETIVMRLLGVGIQKLSIDLLGLEPEFAGVIKTQLARPHGMVLNTGPTGSGKTTTLYSFLNYVNRPELNIVTIEDPIEYQLSGITQSQVDNDKGYTFSVALRAILRQDPDIVLVGEMRDSETAHVAIQAAMTGHLVFSTLHTNDAPGTIPRLMDLGIDERAIISSVNLIMAQRLVRKLCISCRSEVDPSPAVKTYLQQTITRIKAKLPFLKIDLTQLKLYRAPGCQECRGLGYKGRLGVFEFFTITKPIEEALLNRAGLTELRETAEKSGMLTLAEDGILKAVRGITALEEVARVAGEFLPAEILPASQTKVSAK